MANDNIILTKDQEELINTHFPTTPDLSILTRIVFNNDKKDKDDKFELDGRSKEGRAVRQFLVKNNLQYKIIKFEKKEAINLSDDQQKFVLANLADMSVFEMARSLWPKSKITPLSPEYAAIKTYVKEVDPTFYDKSVLPELAEYLPPQNTTDCIGLLSKYKLANLNETGLSQENKDYLKSFFSCMENYRFLLGMNNLVLESERKLFEFQYISYIWGKEQLSQDDIQTCVSMSSEYVTLEQAKKQKNVLDAIIEKELQDSKEEERPPFIKEEANVLGARLQKSIDDSMTAIRQMSKALEGTRSQRMKEKTEANKSIFVLVEQMMVAEKREQLMKIIQLEVDARGAEVDRIETAENYIARIYGVSSQELKV